MDVLNVLPQKVQLKQNVLNVEKDLMQQYMESMLILILKLMIDAKVVIMDVNNVIQLDI